MKELDYWVNEYKTNFVLTTEEIAKKTGLDRTTIEKYFKKIYGEAYSQISKEKVKKLKKPLTEEQKKKISLKLKGKKKPPRSLRHRQNLSNAFRGRNYIERFGEEKAKEIKEKIKKANTGKKRSIRSLEWKQNLSKSLKGRKVWNKGKKDNHRDRWSL